MESRQISTRDKKEEGELFIVFSFLPPSSSLVFTAFALVSPKPTDSMRDADGRREAEKPTRETGAG